jgi:membrane protein
MHDQPANGSRAGLPGLVSIGSLFRQTWAAWNAHDAPRSAAALAFYTVLSLAPLMILMVATLALILQRSTVQDQLLREVADMMGSQSSEAVRGMIEQTQSPTSGALASIAAVVTLLWGASGVFGELRSALNGMWDVQSKAASGIWQMVKEQIFSFGVVLAVGFLLLVSLLVSAGLAALGKFSEAMLPLPEAALSAINLGGSLAATIGLFALIFRYVPETRIPWRDIWIGGAVTAALFTAGKFAIGLYLGKAAVGSAYGAAGSLIVLLVWVYYSAMIFLFGAEFTHILGLDDPRK